MSNYTALRNVNKKVFGPPERTVEQFHQIYDTVREVVPSFGGYGNATSAAITHTINHLSTMGASPVKSGPPSYATLKDAYRR